jgi:serine/threonine protein phosphatase PrpC
VQTPPYLTAMPEVSYHRLTARDKFMVIGSDGLWDMMTPMQVAIVAFASLIFFSPSDFLVNSVYCV